MTDVILDGVLDRGRKDKVKEMRVGCAGEGNYWWFEFILKNGKRVQTGLLKETE